MKEIINNKYPNSHTKLDKSDPNTKNPQKPQYNPSKPPLYFQLRLISKNYEFTCKYSSLIHEIAQLAIYKPDYLLISGLFPSNINYSAAQDRSLIINKAGLKQALEKAKELGIKIIVEFEMNINAGLLPEKYQNYEIRVLDSFEAKIKKWLELQDKDMELKNFEIQRINFLKNFNNLTKSPKQNLKKSKSKSTNLKSFNSMESLSLITNQQHFSRGNLVQLKWSDIVIKKPVNQSTSLNYSNFKVWELTLAELTEIIDTFEEVCPGVLGGFVVRDWDIQPVLFHPDESLLYLKDLRQNYILTKEERRTCCIAKIYEDGYKSKTKQDVYKNEENYDIGHIGKVESKYLGEIGPKTDVYNPFTDFISKGIKTHVQQKNIEQDITFLTKLDVDRFLDENYFKRNEKSPTIISTYNMPSELHYSPLSSVVLKRYIDFFKKISFGAAPYQNFVFKVYTHEQSIFSNLVSKFRVPLCIDFSNPNFDSNYLEYIKIIPNLNEFQVKNQSLGLYFKQELNLEFTDLIAVHPVAEIIGDRVKIFGYYDVGEKELTMFSLSEEVNTTMINVKFLKDLLNVNLSKKKSSNQENFLDLLNQDKESQETEYFQYVLRVEELDKNKSFKSIGFISYYAESDKDEFWSLEEVFDNGLLIDFQVIF